VVDNLFESTEYVPDPERRALQAAIVCYARAVAGPEWAAMGDGETSDVPSAWTVTRAFGGIRAAFKSLSTKVDPANV
jgi:hypothetical protein